MREFEDRSDATAADGAPPRAMPSLQATPGTGGKTWPAAKDQTRDASARELLRQLLADRLRLLAELETAPAARSSATTAAALRAIEQALAADDLRPAWRAVETECAQASGHAALAALFAFAALAPEVLPMTKEGHA